MSVEISEATRHDEGKPPMALLPFDALEEVARVMEFGAKEYGEHNWRKGLSWTKTFSALLRHVGKRLCGQVLDDKTGLPHTAHIACNALFLVAYEKSHTGTDDLWAPSAKEQVL